MRPRYWVILACLAWGCVWAFCAQLDREHCQAHGAAYGGTSASLEGFCQVSGIKVPAEAIGRK